MDTLQKGDNDDDDDDNNNIFLNSSRRKPQILNHFIDLIVHMNDYKLKLCLHIRYCDKQGTGYV
jgi:hypothetical protein